MNRAAATIDPRVRAWWDDVLAGETDEPHPVHGDQLKVHLRGGRLELSGRLDAARDVEELLDQARGRIGSGVHQVDASRLRVAEELERPGILEQTLVAAYIDRATAALAQRLIDEHSRVRPKRRAIVDHTNVAKLGDLLPPGLARQARRRIDRGDALLILRVDEICAYAIRSLMEEETRSVWTLAAPPEPALRG